MASEIIKRILSSIILLLLTFFCIIKGSYFFTILLVTIFLLSACAGKFDAKKLDLRKDCTGDETNKTLSDMFCKKKKVSYGL